MKFAVYSRKSKYTGKGESIGNQIDLCKAYIRGHFDNVEEQDFFLYEDEGFSGKNLERPQFKQLLKDAAAHRFGCIVCYRLDRISRSVVDFSSLVELFSKLEISFVCIREQFDTSTPMGRAMMYIASVFAQLERETIAERVRDNMLLLAREGRWLGGTPPFGFHSKRCETMILDGKRKSSFLLENDPGEGEIVRQIFRLFLSGNNLSQIKRELDRQGALTRGGNCFSVPGIRGILSNPVYAAADRDSCRYLAEAGAELPFAEKNTDAGLLCYHKRSGISGVERKCPPSEWVVARGKHQSIVSGKEWAAAQELLKQLGSQKRKGSHNQYALLSGLLFCKTCGGKMYAKPRSSRSDGSFDYICKSKLLSSAGCSCPNLNGLDADLFVAERFTPLPLFPEVIRGMERLKKELQKSGYSGHEQSAHHDGCGQELERLIALAALPEEEAAKLRNRIQALQKSEDGKPLPTASPEIPGPGEWLSSLPFSERRRLIALLLERVEWDGATLSLICRSGAKDCFLQKNVSL